MTGLPNSGIEPIIELGGLYQAAFEREMQRVGQRTHPTPDAVAFQSWLAVRETPFKPQFGVRMSEAVDWAHKKPEQFGAMLDEVDAAIDFLNHPGTKTDDTVFTNLAEFQRTREVQTLPYFRPERNPEPLKPLALGRAAIHAARKLRLGETTAPDGADYYGFQLFVDGPDGMAAASVIDL